MCRKVVFFLFTLLFINSFAQFAGGSGTYEDPWLIRTPENLDSIRYFLGANYAGKYFKQIADVDLGVAPWNIGEGWDPIGRDTVTYNNFSGFYEGNGYKIKNLYINKPEQDYVGLFGYLGQYPSFIKLTIVNAEIKGGSKTGILAGEAYYAGLHEVFVSGTVSGIDKVGGFVGCCNFAFINNSWNSVNLTGFEYVGGFLGYTDAMPYTLIKDSYSICKVLGMQNTGGLIGYSKYESDVVFSYWNTETSGQLTSAGGEGRTTDEMTYAFPDDTYKYWDFTNIWTEDYQNVNNGYPFLVNGLTPSVPGSPSNLTASCQNGDFTVELSWNNPDTLLNGEPVTELTAVYVYRNFDLIYTNNSLLPGSLESYTDVVSQTGNYTYKVVAVNSAGYGINTRINQPAGNLFADGNGTKYDPYLVSNAEQLNNIRYYTGKDSVYFKQTDTIDLGVAPWNEGKGWIPIGHDESEFRGSYSGSNEFIVIVNLTINDSTRYYSSLFGAIRDAYINNVHLTNVNIYGNASCGALVGNSFTSKISNCSAFGSVSGFENEIGGLIGASIEDSIFCCYANVKVTGKTGIGGLIGLTIEKTAVKNCYATGDVNGNENVGGLIGVNFTSVPTENCYSLGYVSGSNYLGGLLSQTDCLPIHCYWNTETSGQSTSAGGEGRTTFDMAVSYPNDSTYVGWDFLNIWRKPWQSGASSGYPVLYWQSVGIEDHTSSIPKQFTLEQNYPNPFNPVTKISYSVPQGFSGEVKLSVYNANGQLVKELLNGKQAPGNHSSEFNASELNSGLYIYRLETENSTLSKKMILLK